MGGLIKQAIERPVAALNDLDVHHFGGVAPQNIPEPR